LIFEIDELKADELKLDLPVANNIEALLMAAFLSNGLKRQIVKEKLKKFLFDFKLISRKVTFHRVRKKCINKI
jgi:hypothetical protein